MTVPQTPSPARHAAARLWGVDSRNEVLALLALLVSIVALPSTINLGVMGLGTVSGSLLALQGVALVLIYRSNRIINFAQAAFGSSAAILFTTLVQHRSLLRLVEPVCIGDCLSNPVAVQISYWLSLLLTMGFVVLMGWLTYILVIRRFAAAPRLVLTVATIFVGFTALGITGQIAQLLIPSEFKERGETPVPEPARLPFDATREIGGVTFHAVEFLTVGVVVVAILTLFLYLRRSATGTAIRAAAENPDRAATLGVNVNSVTARVWLIAAGLAGLAGVLAAMAQGASGLASGPGAEVRILAVAVVARLMSLPLALAAGVVLGVLEQSLQWALGSTVFLDGGLFLLIGALLLLQSGRMSRAEQSLSGEWRAAREIRPVPGELKSVPIVQTWSRWLLILGGLGLLGLPWLMSPTQTDLVSAILTYSIIGLSLLVLTGWTGQISLGQVGFAAIGAYVVAVSGLPFVLALLAGGISGGVAALLVGIPALRLRGLHLAVLTLAFHQAVVTVGLSPAYLGGFLPEQLSRPSLFGMSADDQRVFYYLCVLMTAAVTLAVLGMRRSHTARALIAARDNEQLAQSFGISLTRARVGAFAMSGAISALAGGLLAYQQQGVPAAAFGVPLSRDIFLYAVIGGLGTVAGPLIGFVYYAVPLLLSLPVLVVLLLAGPGGLLLLLLAPGGIGQLVFDARDNWLRKVARRNRLLVPSLLADAAPDGDEPAALAPKARPGGGIAFTPIRYHLPAQWAIDGVDAARLTRTGATDESTASGEGVPE